MTEEVDPNLLPFPKKANSQQVLRAQVRDLLSEAEPACRMCHQSTCPDHIGRMRRASLVLAMGGSAGLIMSQGVHPDVQLASEILSLAVGLAGMVCMKLADRGEQR